MKAQLLLTVAAACIAFALCVADAHRVGDWAADYAEEIPEWALLPVTIALKPSNLHLLEQLVWSVSDPELPSYGQYLTLDELADLVSPPEEVILTVLGWLKSHHAQDVEVVQTRDAVKAQIPRFSMEKMFGVKLSVYRATTGKAIVRSPLPYTLPKHIDPHVDLVLGVSDFPPITNRNRSLKRLDDQTSLSPSDRPQDPTGGAPRILSAISRGGNAQLSIVVEPTCLDGSTTKTVPPCQDHQGEIVGFDVTLATESDVINSSKAFYSQPNCQLVGNVTHCTIVVPTEYYNAMNVSVRSYFLGKDSGATGYYGFPALSTPSVIPQDIWALYSIPPNTLVTNPNATQCVVEFEEQYYSPTDLLIFLESMGLPTDTPVSEVGPNYPEQPGGEANLDIQYIMGVAPGSPTTFWSIKANSTVEIDHILTWLLQMDNVPNPPLVNSVSYGMTEDNVDKYLGKGYLARTDVELQKAAVRGITVIIASGDTGAGDLGPTPMSSPTCDVLHADWPSQSPYITSVGSTIITPIAEPACYLPRAKGGFNCDNNPLGEVTVSIDAGLFWTSGGGFSNITSTAPYQKAVVDRYLSMAKSQLPPSSVWNAGGRAYPDVATVGHNLMVVLDGTFIPVDGTSASAPIFAGIVTLLNDARLNMGYPPLGFINPLLYRASKVRPQTFYDVTVGNNRCGALGWTPVCCQWGFPAVQGFDAASGLGTPNYAELLDYVMSLPY